MYKHYIMICLTFQWAQLAKRNNSRIRFGAGHLWCTGGHNLSQQVRKKMRWDLRHQEAGELRPPGLSRKTPLGWLDNFMYWKNNISWTLDAFLILLTIESHFLFFIVISVNIVFLDFVYKKNNNIVETPFWLVVALDSMIEYTVLELWMEYMYCAQITKV